MNKRDLEIYSRGLQEGIEMGRKEMADELLKVMVEKEKTRVSSESESREVKSVLVN